MAVVTNNIEIHLATGAVDGQIKLWNLEIQECVRALNNDSNYVYKLDWNPRL